MDEEIKFGVSLNSSRAIIRVEYEWICNQILKRSKRTNDGLITDEAIIEVCVALDKEQDIEITEK